MEILIGTPSFNNSHSSFNEATLVVILTYTVHTVPSYAVVMVLQDKNVLISSTCTYS